MCQPIILFYSLCILIICSKSVNFLHRLLVCTHIPGSKNDTLSLPAEGANESRISLLSCWSITLKLPANCLSWWNGIAHVESFSCLKNSVLHSVHLILTLKVLQATCTLQGVGSCQMLSRRTFELHFTFQPKHAWVHTPLQKCIQDVCCNRLWQSFS